MRDSKQIIHEIVGLTQEYPEVYDLCVELEEKHKTEVDELQQEIKSLKSLIKGHELRNSQNLSIKKKLVARNDELQKRVDACNRLIKKWSNDAEYADQIAQEDFVQNTLQVCIDELEQALKGES